MSSAFGDLTAGLVEAQSLGHGTAEAADNLLLKALDAVGDEARVHRLLERAAALPLDQEGAAPATWAAYMLLNNTVHDELEEADPADVAWLDAAEEVLAGAEGAAERALRSVLDIASQSRQADLSPATDQRLVDLGRGQGDEDAWLAPGPADVEQLLAVVQLTAAYLEAVDRRLQ